MGIFQFGSIIRRRREELGLSQEDLADGICAVATLSRIENGERVPTQNHLEMLLQRLGYSDTLLNSFVDEKDFLSHELKFNIRQTYIKGDYPKATELLDQFEQLNPSPTKFDRQFILLHRLLLNPDRFSDTECLAKFEEALALTLPKWKDQKNSYLLSYEEIILLNNIAICHAQTNNRRYVITLLYRLKEYYDSHIVNTEESIRTQGMSLYNLSKMLGLEGRYDKCIEVCDVIIQIAKDTDKCQCFSEALYNRAWALVRRNCEGDRSEAELSAVKAYQFACILDKTALAQHYLKFIRQNFPNTTLLLL